MSGKLLLFLSKGWNQPSKEQAAKCACTRRKKSWQTSTRRRKKIRNRMTFLLCIFYTNGAPPVLPSVQRDSGLEEKLHELCIDLSCSCRKCIYSLCLLLEQKEGGRDTETCEQNPKHAASELTRQQIRLFPDQNLSLWMFGSTVLHPFFIWTKCHYHSFIKALSNFSASVKFIQINFFLSLQVPAAQKMPSELALSASSAQLADHFLLGPGRLPKHYTEVSNN